jgi:hypothetical protein
MRIPNPELTIMCDSCGCVAETMMVRDDDVVLCECCYSIWLEETEGIC